MLRFAVASLVALAISLGGTLWFMTELKIDRSFVVKMAESGHEAMIVRTTTDLGHNLGLEVVAEGVETAEVEILLREQGCDLAQGYHFSRPCLPADLDGILRERRAPATANANHVVPGT